MAHTIGSSSHQDGITVEGVAEELLVNADQVAQAVTVRRDLLPTYSGGVISTAELEQSGAQSLRIIAHYLTGTELPPGLVGFTSRLGRTRAELGIPSGELHIALNFDFEAIWEFGGRYSDRMSSEGFHAFGRTLWAAIERYTREVLDAYRTRETELLRHDDTRRQYLLAQLFSDRELAASGCQHILSSAGLNVERAVNLYLYAGAPESMSTIFGSATGLYTVFVGEGFLAAITPEHVRPLPDAPAATVVAEAIALDDFAPTAIAAQEFFLLLGSDRRRHRHALDDVWLDFAAARMESHAEAIGSGRVGRLMAKRPQTQDSLIESAECFFESGSVAEVAARRFLHRNTIRMHLQTLHDLTGFDPHVPSQLANLIVAIRALRAAEKR